VEQIGRKSRKVTNGEKTVTTQGYHCGNKNRVRVPNSSLAHEPGGGEKNQDLLPAWLLKGKGGERVRYTGKGSTGGTCLKLGIAVITRTDTKDKGRGGGRSATCS